MTDLNKILLAAAFAVVSGVAGTLIGEPLKQRLLLRRKRNVITKTVLRELNRFRGTMIFIRVVLDRERGEKYPGIKKSMDEVFVNAVREAFDHYYENEKEALLAVEDWESLVRTYIYLGAVKKRYVENTITLGDAVDSCINITDGELKKRGFETFKNGTYFDKEKMNAAVKPSPSGQAPHK